MPTPLLGFTHLEENSSSPEIRVNELADNAEYSVHGYLAINFSSDADLTLSTSGSFPRQWQYGFIRLNDTGPVLTTGRNVVVPALAKRTVFWNNTAQELTIKTSGGTGVAIAAGETSEVQCDGTNVISADGGGGTDNDTTYTISAESDTGGVSLKLTGSDSSEDDVYFAEGTGMTVTRTDANTITLSASAAASVLDMPVQSKSANYTLVSGDQGNLLNVDASGANRTITLLAAASAGDGYTVAIKKTDATANTVTIDGNGAETIDGSTTKVISTQYDTVLLACNGTAWFILAEPAAGGSGADLDTANTWTAGQRGEVTTLTSSSNSVAVNLADSNNFELDMTENTTLAAPTNATEGQSGFITITQDNTTAFPLAYNTFWEFENGSTPSLSTTLLSRSTFVYYVDAGGSTATCNLIGPIS